MNPLQKRVWPTIKDGWALVVHYPPFRWVCARMAAALIIGLLLLFVLDLLTPINRELVMQHVVGAITITITLSIVYFFFSLFLIETLFLFAMQFSRLIFWMSSGKSPQAIIDDYRHTKTKHLGGAL